MQKIADELKLSYKARIYNTNYMNRFKVVDRSNILNMLSVYYPELRKFRQLEKINNLLNINQYKQFIQYSDTINQSFFTQPEKNIFLIMGWEQERHLKQLFISKKD